MLTQRLAAGTVHSVDRSVPRDIAGEIENAAVILAVRKAHAAAEHLNV